MKHANDIRRVFQKAELDVAPDADERVFEDVLQARQKVAKHVPAMPDSIGRVIMKNPFARLAIAATVLVACVIGLSLWRTTGSGIALADVLARIEQVAAYRYQVRSVITTATPQTRTDLKNTVLISQEHGIKYTTKRVDPNNNEIDSADTYLLPRLNSMIFVVHEKKMYVPLKFDDGKLHNYKEEYNDPHVIVKQILGCDHTSLGQSVIDGITVEGFQTTDSAYEGGFMGQADFGGRPEKVDVKLWVDVDTFLPVRVEEDVVAKSGLRMHEVSYDFRWNVAVNADDFEPVKPEGYRSPGEIAVPASSEDDAIRGLRAFASLAAEYPTSLDAVSLNKRARKLIGLGRDTFQQLADDEKTRLKSELMSIMAPAFFYEKLTEPAYYGQSVTPKDADKVLLRWKVSDNEYRVIFGDLHTQTVTAEVLAHLEKNLPK